MLLSIRINVCAKRKLVCMRLNRASTHILKCMCALWAMTKTVYVLWYINIHLFAKDQARMYAPNSSSRKLFKGMRALWAMTKSVYALSSKIYIYASNAGSYVCAKLALQIKYATVCACDGLCIQSCMLLIDT